MIRVTRFAKVIAMGVLILLELVGCVGESQSKHFSDNRVISVEAYDRLLNGSDIKEIYKYPDFLPEYATHVLLCHIVSTQTISYSRTYYKQVELTYHTLKFRYNAEIVDVLMDTTGSCVIGDRISVHTTSGMARIKDLQKEHLLYQEAIFLGIDPQKDYSENEYLISGTEDSIPIEVGKTYLMFLREYQGEYAEIGYSELYECDGDMVYAGRSMTRMEQSASELQDEIRTRVKGRTGILERIDLKEYLDQFFSETETNHS